MPTGASPTTACRWAALPHELVQRVFQQLNKHDDG